MQKPVGKAKTATVFRVCMHDPGKRCSIIQASFVGLLLPSILLPRKDIHTHEGDSCPNECGGRSTIRELVKAIAVRARRTFADDTVPSSLTRMRTSFKRCIHTSYICRHTCTYLYIHVSTRSHGQRLCIIITTAKRVWMFIRVGLARSEPERYCHGLTIAPPQANHYIY